MTKLQNIAKIAKKLGLKKKNIDCYGNYMAKINEIKMQKAVINGIIRFVIINHPFPC